MTHTDLINKLIKQRGYKRYLEIGTYRRGDNFDKINCQWKFCIDPDPVAMANFQGTSDEFFEQNYVMFDLVFCDGLHHADQVKKDFENSMKFLSEDGCIIFHDSNPPNIQTTCVPRGTQREWNGDVYQFACTLHGYDGIDFLTWKEDYGCTVVWKDITKMGSETEEISWETFDKNRAELLRFREWDKIV